MKRNKRTSWINKILVPTDFSSYSSHAMDYASIIAKQLRAKIILMHVIESFPYSVTDTLNVIDHRRALETSARSLLESLSQGVVKKGLSVKTHLVSGTPYREILDRIAKDKIDLVVMGTRGRMGFAHLLLGSVAEKVVRLSTCPVLTIPISSGRRAATRQIMKLAVGASSQRTRGQPALGRQSGEQRDP